MTKRHFTAEELSAWLDGELELDAARQAHLKECPQCIRAVESQQGLRRIARRATPPVPTDRMWKEIDARTAGTAPGRSPMGLFDRLRFSLRRKQLPVAGLATGLAMVAIVIATRPVPRQIEVVQPPALKEEPVAPVETTRPAPAAPPSGAGTDKGRSPATPKRSLAQKKKAVASPPSEQPAAAAPQPETAQGATRKDEAPPAPAADNRATDLQRAPAPAQTAPRPARRLTDGAAAGAEAPVKTARARSVRSSAMPEAAAPSAAPMAAEAESQPAPRVTWTGRLVVITADREWKPTADRIVLTGHVLILPVVSGSPYVGTIDGLTRTLTGQTPASVAEIHLPGEDLHIKR